MVEPRTDTAQPSSFPSPRILPRARHTLSRRSIDPNALKVLYRLERSGFESCLVGGSVRDLLLGREPKDFDVATDARPGEVRRLFRNSRIIGRRFRLVHVYFRDSIVEVSTFRAGAERDAEEPEVEHAAAAGGHAGLGQDGLEEEVEGDGDDFIEDVLAEDNVFGSPPEDAFRRDFTINALFYRIADFSVVDYVGGVEDLGQGLIRVIGDPNIRFREDPVRMLRACELAGRLGFRIDDDAQRAIRRWRREMAKASPARLVEELLEILRSGHAGRTLQWLLEVGLAEIWLPELQAMLDAEEEGLGPFGRILPVLDRVVGGVRDASDSLLLACLLAPSVVLQRHRREERRRKPLARAEVRAIVASTIDALGERFALSHARARRTASTLELFQRLCEPPPLDWTVRHVTAHPGYQEAVLLFEMLADATGEGHEMLEAWRMAALEA
ncbi:MAG TPA: polynucleotide adenylyltransferase PcnB, partial [Thermoanaerobaculia bacterium]|nr:polynucleotide adenylyltransferase PcnB [Thermoanaerobaculia bacterium]